MSITATELKQNLGMYLSLAATEPIYITQYGKTIAVISDPKMSMVKELDSLCAKFKPVSDDEIEQDRWERLSEKCGL